MPVLLSKLAAHPDFAAQLDQAKTPEERKRLYREYQKDVEKERYSKPARVAKGLALGLVSARIVDEVTKGKASKFLGRGYYPGAAILGLTAGQAFLGPRKNKIETLPKTAYIAESKYWPIGDVMSHGHVDSTVAELSNSNMPEGLRKELLRSRVAIHSSTKPSVSVSTGGGRVIGIGRDVPAVHRPALIAHELGHHKGKHITKNLAIHAAMIGAGTALGSKYIAPVNIPGTKWNLSGAAFGAGLGEALSLLTTTALASERQERQADRFAVGQVGGEATKAAVRYSTEAAKPAQQKAFGRIRPPWRSKEKHEQLMQKKTDDWYRGHTERPATAVGRALSRLRYGAASSHPPLWSRLESIDQASK